MKNATFFVADAQCDDLRGPYDHVFSRFGTMFFYLPGLALRNFRRVLAPGGELSMIVGGDAKTIHGCMRLSFGRGKLSLSSPLKRPTRCIAAQDRSRWPARTWSATCCGALDTSMSLLPATTQTFALAALWTRRRFKHLVRHREESCALAIQDAVSSIADARSFAPGPTMPRYAQSK
jgi:hypothetical protein